MKKRTVLTAILVAGSWLGISAQKAWSLRECIEYAIDNNIRIRQQAVYAEQDRNDMNTAKYARLPNLSAGASQNFNWGRAASPVDNTYTNTNSSNSDFSLSTNVPLFTGLQLPNQYALSKLNLAASLEDLRKAKEDLTVNVTSYFLQVLYNRELYRISLEQLALTRQQYDRAVEMNAVGKLAVSEVADARARMAQDEYSVVQAKNNYELALLDLSQLLELPSPEGFEVEEPDDSYLFAGLAMPEVVFNDAVMIRPEIRAAQYRLEGAAKSIKVAQSSFYPQLSFRAGLGTGYYNVSGNDVRSFSNQLSDNLNKYLGFTLSIPIFNRFSVRNNVRNARLQQTYLGLQLDNTRKELYKEIQQAYYNALAAESKFTTSGIAVEANQTSFELTREKFENGKATSLEYNESKYNLMRSLSEQAQARYEYLFQSKILEFYRGVEIR